MTDNKVSLVIHPVRLRILQTLIEGSKTTHEISLLLPDVPTSSLYRHLKILLEGKMIAVLETRLVRGIQEKVYQIAQSPHLVTEDLIGIKADEHLQMFITYVITLLQGYANYLERTPLPDPEDDRVGYSEVTVWVTNEQLDEFGRKLNEALIPLLSQEPGAGRHRHKLAVITHPYDNSRTQDD